MKNQGRQFQFDTFFCDDKRGTEKCFGPINLYQIGELSCMNGFEIPNHKQWCHEISFVINGEGHFTTDT
ncbi:MAG TPA: hypothetical protein PLT66_06520, partial [Bacillota bacterium]|nr:hypothetical protein [Bacillota bacterium]